MKITPLCCIFIPDFQHNKLTPPRHRGQCCDSTGCNKCLMPPNLTYEQCLQVTFPSGCPPVNCSHLIEPPTSNGTGTFMCIGHTSLCLWIMLLLLCVALTYVCESACVVLQNDYRIAGNFRGINIRYSLFVIFVGNPCTSTKFFSPKWKLKSSLPECIQQGKRNFYSRKSPCWS